MDAKPDVFTLLHIFIFEDVFSYTIVKGLPFQAAVIRHHKAPNIILYVAVLQHDRSAGVQEFAPISRIWQGRMTSHSLTHETQTTVLPSLSSSPRWFCMQGSATIGASAPRKACSHVSFRFRCSCRCDRWPPTSISVCPSCVVSCGPWELFPYIRTMFAPEN
jgi:hypothetical protein